MTRNPSCDRDELRPGKQRHRIPDQPDEREGAHSPKGIVFDCGLMLLALQSNKERQEENQQDLHSFRRQ